MQLIYEALNKLFMAVKYVSACDYVADGNSPEREDAPTTTEAEG